MKKFLCVNKLFSAALCSPFISLSVYSFLPNNTRPQSTAKDTCKTYFLKSAIFYHKAYAYSIKKEI